MKALWVSACLPVGSFSFWATCVTEHELEENLTPLWSPISLAHLAGATLNQEARSHELETSYELQLLQRPDQTSQSHSGPQPWPFTFFYLYNAKNHTQGWRRNRQITLTMCEGACFVNCACVFPHLYMFRHRSFPASAPPNTFRSHCSGNSPVSFSLRLSPSCPDMSLQ